MSAFNLPSPPPTARMLLLNIILQFVLNWPKPRRKVSKSLHGICKCVSFFSAAAAGLLLRLLLKSGEWLASANNQALGLMLLFAMLSTITGRRSRGHKLVLREVFTWGWVVWWKAANSLTNAIIQAKIYESGVDFRRPENAHSSIKSMTGANHDHPSVSTPLLIPTMNHVNQNAQVQSCCTWQTLVALARFLLFRQMSGGRE